MQTQRKRAVVILKRISERNTQKEIDDIVQDFDNSFRTAEAHGPGILRKWTLSMESIDENPELELLGFWNEARQMMVEIGKSFFSPDE